ncbi:uncharacterized protein LOC117570403 isoform X2 [Drosophila albomicans]|uniref:Uncharacterized protein LOC117570403 isoform X2 n=1 Tax=Drosophila albomicans TaxID=7291 RepID=A0A9C6WET6_DROAB|nr:uncharacterized protein LOC117570403 isoform X2 [Drosophila albomicans]
MVKPLEKAGCLELRTAGLIIGWLGVFGSILYFCIATVTLVKAVKEADYVAAENGEVARSHDQTESVFVLGGTLIGVLILGAVVSGLLIYGINQNRHSMLLPWLVLSTFSLVLSYFQLLGALFDFVAFSHSFPLFFYQVISTGLNSYIYYVIYSLYTHMKMDSGKGRVLTPAQAAAVPLQPAYSNYDKV